MAKRCKAKTKAGDPCGAWAVTGSKFCFMHSPSKRKERAAARKLGGYNRKAAPGGDPDGLPGEIRSMSDVLAVLDFALSDALMLENSISRGRLLVAIVGAFIQALREGEFEQRITALEERIYGEKQR